MRIAMIWLSLLLLFSGCAADNKKIDRYTGSYEKEGWEGEFIFDSPEDTREGTLKLTYTGDKSLGKKIQYIVRNKRDKLEGTIKVTGKTLEQHLRFGEPLNTTKYLEVTVLMNGGAIIFSLTPPE